MPWSSAIKAQPNQAPVRRFGLITLSTTITLTLDCIWDELYSSFQYNSSFSCRIYAQTHYNNTTHGGLMSIPTV